MFEHELIDKYAITDVPLDCDIYLMDERWLADYERALLDGLGGADWTYPGFITFAAARTASPDGIELSWYPNTHDRFHEVRIFLPSSAFILCVGCWQYDEKPRIFVKSEWFEDIHLRVNSVFALVDAIGVKSALRAEKFGLDVINELRNEIDVLAATNLDVSFITFADNLLLKSNWTVGSRNSEVSYTYKPEVMLRVVREIAEIYRRVASLEIYAAITQGRNEVASGELMHLSPSGNHISLNSLGLPFAQLQAIEAAAKARIKSGVHTGFQLYMDKTYFHSLDFDWQFDKNAEPNFPYDFPMSATPSRYFCGYADDLISKLK